MSPDLQRQDGPFYVNTLKVYFICFLAASSGEFGLNKGAYYDYRY
jgi:hypothetical protein